MTTDRSYWVDNLRTFAIVLVVNMHACVTYSFVGNWYYDAPPEPAFEQKIPFALWQAHLQSFFMGLLFFIAGYYADRSLARRGAKSFVRERVRRLLIPLVIYMVAIHPLIIIGLHPGDGASATPLRDYIAFLSSGRVLAASGPMWFVFALFAFSLVFAGAARFLPSPDADAEPMNLKGWSVLAFGLGVGLLSFAVRLVQPLGTQVLNFQLCFFSQYVVAFALGIWVSRRDSLLAIATNPLARRVGIAACVLGPIGLVGILLASMPVPKTGPPHLAGGMNFPAMAFALWEQLAGASFALGAMYLFATRFHRPGKVLAWLSDRSFAVYMLHPPILVFVTIWMQPFRTSPGTMAAVLTVVGLAASFGVADLTRRVPGLRLIL